MNQPEDQAEKTQADADRFYELLSGTNDLESASSEERELLLVANAIKEDAIQEIGADLPDSNPSLRDQIEEELSGSEFVSPATSRKRLVYASAVAVAATLLLIAGWYANQTDPTPVAQSPVGQKMVPPIVSNGLETQVFFEDDGDGDGVVDVDVNENWGAVVDYDFMTPQVPQQSAPVAIQNAPAQSVAQQQSYLFRQSGRGIPATTWHVTAPNARDYGTNGGWRYYHSNGAQVTKNFAWMDDYVTTWDESYDSITENGFTETTGENAISTFSIDVDTASYSNMRRFLRQGMLPPVESIRAEEWINYFCYDDPTPRGDVPFAVHLELAQCPWNDANQLLRIGLKGKEIHRAERPASNLVFLLDVSGSMSDADKLPLLQRSLMMMLEHLQENDRISIVTYAGDAGVRLLPTSGDQKRKIGTVIEDLNSGGSTHGSAGIERAYELATETFIKGGVNRVILATDGDLNVGITDDEALVELIESKAKSGVFLTVLGFGTGNLKDSKMEKLADNGNGVYAYIDSMREARKVLVEQMSSSLVTIAKDVKLQIEFNPAEVKAYRLIGYENRMLATEDFDNDAKDAGEIGAGHTVTALYELVTGELPEAQAKASPVAPTLKYQATTLPAKEQVEGASEPDTTLTEAAKSGELATLAIRYKAPDADKSKRLEFVCESDVSPFADASTDFQFASSVASFAMVLRQSQYKGAASLESTLEMASRSIGEDSQGYRAEFVDLVRQAIKISQSQE